MSSKTSKKPKDNEVKVVRVTKTEFELSDGRIYPHPFEFAEAPTLQAFRQHYRLAKTLVLDLMAKQDQKTAKTAKTVSKAVKAAKKPDKPKESPQETNEQ